MLEHAYNVYRSRGFVMQLAAKNQKFSIESGGYADRVNDEFSETATGYASIVPPEIIIVDNDSYKDEGKSFNQFLADMGYSKGDIVPFAKTPSGGEHYAFVNKYPTKKIGAKQGVEKRYPYLDVFTGYQSVIPCVGTKAFSKFLNKVAEYQWSDDNFEEDIILNPWNDNFITLFDMKDRGISSASGYDDLEFAIKEDAMPDSEVERLIDAIPNSVLDYDNVYLPVGMALYDRYQGEARGLELFQKFCAKVESGNNPDQNESKWMGGHFKGSQITFKRLNKLYKQLYFKEQIAKADSESDLEAVISEIKTIPNMMVDNTDMRKTYANSINARYKDLKKEKKINDRVPQIKSILTDMTPVSESTPQSTHVVTKVYLCDGMHYVQHGIDLFENIGAQIIGKYLRSFGYRKDEADGIMENATAVRSIYRTPDYLIKEDVIFELQDRGTNAPDLIQKYNPLSHIELVAEDEDILHDFLTDIWAGKIDDIVKLIALTIKFKEKKLNRLMLVAPSNSGKSAIFSHLGFQKINISRLISAMRGDKGVGSQIITGIRRSGLLLIDEANTALPADIKDMDNELQVDQFQKGGTQVLPLHFTGLTSTHKTATSYNSDELYNRFLQIELTRDEMQHTIMESPLYLENSDHYTSVVQSYMLRTFMEWVRSDAKPEELYELQRKYRLPSNEAFSETLTRISDEVISIYRSSVTATGDVIKKGDLYYIKRKSDLKSQITMLVEQLHETTNIDIGKYSERLYEHFLGEGKQTSVRIGDTPIKYYELNLKPYYEDKTQEVINHFDDLDLQEL